MNVDKIREDFPILKRLINGKKLIYFDNAATSQKPIQVIDAISDYYKNHNANVHRGVHKLSEEATQLYEEARTKIKNFINASTEKEIIYVRNASEAINLVMYAWGKKNINKGDKIVVSIMEHHSNFVPWQQLAKEKNAKLEFLFVNEEGEIEEKELEKIHGAKLVAITHVSNVLGSIVDVKTITKIAHGEDALCLVDGSQSVPHMPLDVRSIGCDFLAFTGHKMLGPTGIGVLYGKEEILNDMEPFMFGGDMIFEVHKESTRWNELPYKFEAGTPNIAGAIGLGAAVDYLKKIGMHYIRKHEKELTEYAIKKMSEVKGIRVLGTKNAEKRGGVIAFNIDKIHPHDVAALLGEDGIAIRSGHHCAMPLHEELKESASARASFYLYNTKEEIDVFVESLKKVSMLF
jgi:cysteine desulfurase/selenocysteine lyase